MDATTPGVGPEDIRAVGNRSVISIQHELWRTKDKRWYYYKR